MRGRVRENVDAAVNGRVKAVRLALGLSQTEFCKAILLSNGHYTELELCNRPVNRRIISLICSRYRVREQYLTAEEGPMFDNPAEYKLDEVIRIFRELPPDFQDYLVRHIKEMKRLARGPAERNGPNVP
jgi:transcriptional regulator with XRE-family HTH domain